MPLHPTGKVDRIGLKRLADDHVAAHPEGALTWMMSPHA
jgi:hypothetical protein